MATADPDNTIAVSAKLMLTVARTSNANDKDKPRRSYANKKNRNPKDKLRPSAGGYIPPHMRGQNLTPSTTPKQKRKSATAPNTEKATPAKTGVTVSGPGPLRDAAVEIFERAYGLNGRKLEDYNDLLAEITARYQCSEKALYSLILGHSYDDILGPLRAQVPGYITKEEAKLQRSKEKAARREKAKSCNSSPTTIIPSPPPERNTVNDPSFLLLPDQHVDAPFSETPSPLGKVKPSISHSSPSSLSQEESTPQKHTPRSRLFTSPDIETDFFNTPSILNNFIAIKATSNTNTTTTNTATTTTTTETNTATEAKTRSKRMTQYASSSSGDADCRSCTNTAPREVAGAAAAAITAAAIPLLYAAMQVA